MLRPCVKKNGGKNVVITSDLSKHYDVDWIYLPILSKYSALYSDWNQNTEIGASGVDGRLDSMPFLISCAVLTSCFFFLTDGSQLHYCTLQSRKSKTNNSHARSLKYKILIIISVQHVRIISGIFTVFTYFYVIRKLK